MRILHRPLLHHAVAWRPPPLGYFRSAVRSAGLTSAVLLAGLWQASGGGTRKRQYGGGGNVRSEVSQLSFRSVCLDFFFVRQHAYLKGEFKVQEKAA